MPAAALWLDAGYPESQVGGCCCLGVLVELNSGGHEQEWSQKNRGRTGPAITAPAGLLLLPVCSVRPGCRWRQRRRAKSAPPAGCPPRWAAPTCVLRWIPVRRCLPSLVCFVGALNPKPLSLPPCLSATAGNCVCVGGCCWWLVRRLSSSRCFGGCVGAAGHSCVLSLDLTSLTSTPLCLPPWPLLPRRLPLSPFRLQLHRLHPAHQWHHRHHRQGLLHAHELAASQREWGRRRRQAYVRQHRWRCGAPRAPMAAALPPAASPAAIR